MQWRLQKGLGLYYDGYVTDISAFPQQFTRLNDHGKTIAHETMVESLKEEPWEEMYGWR